VEIGRQIDGPVRAVGEAQANGMTLDHFDVGDVHGPVAARVF
jgi:hypothetical protein